MPLLLRFWTALTGVALTLAATQTQAPQPSGQPKPFKAGIEVVVVTATVVDESGALVTDLTRDDFAVFEDGTPQAITQFTSDRVPVSLGLLLDSSDSMHGQRMADARIAVSRFLFDLLSRDDEFFVMAFNHEPRLLVPWTNRSAEAAARLADLHPWGATAIYDAVVTALPEFERRSRQRAAIVVISDGADTASDVTVRQVRSALLRSDAFVYGVAIDAPDRRPINRAMNPYALREITDDTGGRTVVVQNTSELGQATASIAEELNHQYVLGYTPAHKPDGQYHSIRVRSTKAGLRVRARRGYVAGEGTR